MRIPLLATALAGAFTAAPATAQEVKISADRYAVTVRRADLHPATPAAARRTLARLEAAALLACGGAEGSLGATKRAIRHSPCWQDGMAGAMARIDDPLLLQAYHNRS